ncbi:MAG: type VI secretion system baseplate subunit TssG [Myxococcota bacterium]
MAEAALIEEDEDTPEKRLSRTLAFFEQGARQFDFYRLIYLLQRLFPDAPRLGHTGPVAEEKIRIRGETELVFHTSDIEGFRYRKFPDEILRTEVDATFLGLYGTASPLPPHIVEKIALDVFQGGPQPLRELFDVIHHRLFSLAYRGWSKYRISVGYRQGGNDVFTKRMLCAVGIDGFNDPESPRAGLERFFFLRFAPLLATKSRSARGLSVVLEEVFGHIGIGIEQFVGNWTKIDKPLRNALGRRNHQLGQSLTLGRYVFDGSGRYRLKLGPLDYDDYLSFLPGGHRRPLLQQVVDTFTPGMHDVILELNVDLKAAPRFQLSSPRSATIGRTAWLGGSSGDGSFRIDVPLYEQTEEELDDDDDRYEPPPMPR